MKRSVWNLAAAANALGFLLLAQVASANTLSSALATLVPRVEATNPTLAPIMHTIFCSRYPADCKTSGEDIASLPESSSTLLGELRKVNQSVNQSIAPQPNNRGLAGEEWLISPGTGDCNDYAVTKRHELLARGWPPSALLLAEVITTTRKHHLVLIVRFKNGDVVLDNLLSDVTNWTVPRYDWVRLQSPDNPRYWLAVDQPNVSVASRVRVPSRALARGPAARQILADNWSAD
jgi:predicted transglutaminase-like cysteine proteinase